MSDDSDRLADEAPVVDHFLTKDKLVVSWPR
jgi:hypothetical protein